MIITMIMMNMQNKLYTKQFTHSLMTKLQPLPKQRSQNPELEDFEDLNSQKKKERDSCPRLTPIYKQNKTSMVWNISIGQLGLSVWLCSLPASAHLLIN